MEPHHVKPHPLQLEVNIRDPDLPPAAWAAMAGGKTGGERSEGGHAGQVSPFHTGVLQDGHLGIFVKITIIFELFFPQEGSPLSIYFIVII